MGTVSPWQFILVALSAWVRGEQDKVIEYLTAENRALREKLGNKRVRFTDEQRRRLAVKGHALGRKALRELGPIVTPDTILRWYRELIAEKYDGSEQRKMGRPRTPDELQDLVTRMARENPGWGYTRIRDALGNLGYELARTTIRSILKEHGIDPAPEPPVAQSITISGTMVTGQEIIFTGAGSIDEIYSKYGESDTPKTFKWKIGGSTKYGAVVNHKFSAAGTYTIKLQVYDGTYWSPAKSKTVTIGNSSPPPPPTCEPCPTCCQIP